MLKNLPNGNETIPYTVEQEVKLPYPEKGGYFFEGWSGTGMTGQEYYVTIPEGTTGNREYTAHWKPTTYEIAFLMNGGEPLASISYTVESPDFDLPIPVRNGYKFVGWTSDGITVPQEIVTIHQGSMGFRMYTANWKVIEYTITLDERRPSRVSDKIHRGGFLHPALPSPYGLRICRLDPRWQRYAPFHAAHYLPWHNRQPPLQGGVGVWRSTPLPWI